MRELLLAVVLLAAVLAGCIGSDDAPLESANATDAGAADVAEASIPTFPNGTPAPTTLEFSDCYEHIGVFPVPESAYEDRLPEGFSLVPYFAETTGFGETRGETAELAVFARECPTSDGSTVSRASVIIYVDPPDAWEHPADDADHALVLSVMTTSERVAAVYDAWGFADVAAVGQVGLENTQNPAARTGTLQASAGDASLEMRTTTEGLTRESDGGLSRQFALAEDGTVTGARDWNWTEIQFATGQATVSGSPEAGLPDGMSVPPGPGFHVWELGQRLTYFDLPPREGS